MTSWRKVVKSWSLSTTQHLYHLQAVLVCEVIFCIVEASAGRLATNIDRKKLLPSTTFTDLRAENTGKAMGQ